MRVVLFGIRSPLILNKGAGGRGSEAVARAGQRAYEKLRAAYFSVRTWLGLDDFQRSTADYGLLLVTG